MKTMLRAWWRSTKVVVRAVAWLALGAALTCLALLVGDAPPPKT